MLSILFSFFIHITILSSSQKSLCYLIIRKYPNMQQHYPLLLILSLTLFTHIICAPLEDLVTQNITHLPYDHKWYSGYLNFSKSYYHYVFFDSQHDPDNDPLVLWLNGGPGCSSLIGMVYENGPFVFEPNTSFLVTNEYAWNKKANLLYIESPGGVGFSKGNRKIYDDGNTAEDNLQALLAFFKKFPELKKNDFYISGESYSGIYVPYLAYEIIKHNKLPESSESKIKLKGTMVGNACTHPKQCYDATAQGNSMYQYQFLYRHTYYSEKDYEHLLAVCTLGFHTEQCIEQRNRMDGLFAATNSSILNIYQPCYYQVGQEKPRMKTIHQSKFLPQGDMDCNDLAGIHYFFNIPGIYEFLHVDHVEFQACSDYVADTYVSFANASYWIYPILIKEGLRVWVYSGDVDADVPITGTLAWLNMFREQHGVPVMQPWRQWWVKGLHKHEDQVGGMVWELKNLTFVSIKGAGHMVPKDKPKEAEVMFTSFLEGVSPPQKEQ